MLSVAAYSVSHSYASVAKMPGGVLAYLRGVSFGIWMFSLVALFWKISDYWAFDDELRAGDLKGYYFIGFGICMLAHLTLGLPRWFAAPFEILQSWSGRLFTIFCAVALVTSPLSRTPFNSAKMAIATWGVFVLLHLYWQSDYRIVRRMLVLTGIIIQIWFFILLFKLGLAFGFGSWIGGINRNMSASAVLGGMICCMVSPSKTIRLASIASCTFMAVIVTSRSTIIALIVFLLIYYVLLKGTVRGATRIIILVGMAAAVMLVIPSLADFVFGRVLLLADKGRGIGSGFTGRFDFWKDALDEFWRSPIIGQGFRSAAAGSAHSGYLRIAAETGFVGFFLAVGAVALEAVRRFRLIMQLRELPQSAAPSIDVAESTRLNVVAGSTVIMAMVYWVFEQQYINLGSILSIVYFLMIFSPAYIPRQFARVR